jgi:hypothetical protein
MMEQPMDAVSTTADPALAANGISDRRFAAQLEAIQKLKRFLFDEKVLLQTDVLESIDLGALNNLKYAPAGRMPTEGEWRALDQKLASLTPLLSPALRWKFCIRELHFFFITVPIFFMATTIIATLSLALLMTFGDGESFFFVISYVTASLIWTLSQGALGACAFLCVNATVHALKEQSASNPLHQAIDVTDESILSVRVVLGALFALLIAVPIGGKSIVVVYRAFTADNPVPPIEDWIIALVPFMLGFSTTLVLAIFNRIIGGISTMFGISGGTTVQRE